MTMKRARVAVLRIRIEGDGLGRRDVCVTDFVELQRLGRQVLERVDVDLVLELGDGAGTILVPILIRYWRCGSSSSSAIHSKCAANWSETSGRASGAARMSPREISISSARTDRDRLPGARLVKVAVHGDDARDLGRLAPTWQPQSDRPAVMRPTHDGAGKAAEIEIGPVHPLHRHAERAFRQARFRRRRFRDGQQRRTLVPGHALGCLR